MAQQLSLQQLIQYFAGLAAQHGQISTFFYGPKWDVSVTKEAEYPIMIVIPQRSLIRKDSLVLRHKIQILDQLDKGVENRNNILSDSLQTCLDIKAFIWKDFFYDIFPTDTSDIEPYYENYDDELGGWSMDVDLQLDWLAGVCDIPGLFPSGVTFQQSGQVMSINLANYLLLTGGVLTGGLTGTTADFLSGLTTNSIQITSGAVNGYVLVSDTSGNGTWQPVSRFTGNDITGVTYNTSTGVETFYNSTGGTIVVTGFTVTDRYWTSGSTGFDSIHANNNSGLDATGDYSTAEGYATLASGYVSHAEGYNSTASGYISHAEGQYSTAQGNSAHAEGYQGSAIGDFSHAEGVGSESVAIGSHAEGQSTFASGSFSHSEGTSTTSFGTNSHAEGNYSVSSGVTSHAEGNSTTAKGDNSHSEGNNTKATATNSHAEGTGTLASGTASHAEGNTSQAIGNNSHAEGFISIASGDTSHAEGQTSIALGSASHAEGNTTVSSGNASHSEGSSTTAIGFASHSEGSGTLATGDESHAEGLQTTATGKHSHVEGAQTTAIGANSHAGGSGSVASGDTSFVHGGNSIASGQNTVVLGTGITGLTNNTTYVDHLNIKTVPSGSLLNNLGIDASGNVIVGTTGSTEIHTTAITWNTSSDILTLTDNTGSNLTATLNTFSAVTLNGSTLATGNMTVNGNATILGNVIVLGTASTINTNSEVIATQFLYLNGSNSGSTQTPSPLNSGIASYRGSGSTAVLIWSETNKDWELGYSGATARIAVLTGGTFTGQVNAPTLSATTYLNLPTDIHTTGLTYSNNTFTIADNVGNTYPATINSVTGLTSTGLISSTNISATTLSASTGFNFSLAPTAGYVLTSDANGNATWQVAPTAGLQAFFFYSTSSDIAGYDNMLRLASTRGAQTISNSSVSSTTILQSFATISGTPNLTFIPAGIMSVYITAAQTAGSKTSQVYAEIYKRTTGGTETLLATTSNSAILTGVAVAQLIQATVTATTLNLSDRIVTKIRALVTGGGSAPTIVLTVEDSTAGRTELPSNVVDVTNFVPYTGGTSNVNLNGYNLNTSGGITATTISATTYLGMVDTFVTGGTYSAGTAVFTNNTGGTFSVTGFSTSNATSFTGGTVTGATNFTGGLTANTISATSITAITYTNTSNVLTASTTATSINWSSGQSFLYTVTSTATTFSFSNTGNGQTILVGISQDATGGRTITLPSNVKWSYGFVPVPTTAATKTDIFTFVSLNNNIYGTVIQNC